MNPTVFAFGMDSPMTATATYLGANGWFLDVAGLRLLVDPWLFGPLVFPWPLAAERRNAFDAACAGWH